MTRIRVRMLGKLEISCEGREIRLKCTKDSRYMQLFLLLLYHNKKGISRQEIIEELYAGKESSPDNALRIVVYRLRKLLSQTFLPKEKFVVSDRKGQYRLGENITVTLDTDDFLSMYEKINGASDEADRICRLSQTCDLYEGHFLKDFHGETWIEIENSYFQRLYLKASKELAALLEKRRQYRELRELTDKNIRLFPYDGWQFLRIRSLAQEGKKKEAAIIYEETLRAFQEEFGAAYLGECALVPYDSPVANCGALFYNTLFDENASCHLALGRGFNNCVAGWEGYSLDEIRAMGVNDSVVHADFMIGTEDLSVTGVAADGSRIPIFKNGGWAI